MRHPLDGVDAKLRRGFSHAGVLHREVEAFFKDHPHRVELEAQDDSANPGWYLARLRIHKEPPLRLSVIAGEALGQFRSSLDHLIKQAFLLGPKPKGARNFPIFGPGEFFEPTGPGRKPPVDWWRESLRPAHFAIVESLQPTEPEALVGSLGVIGALARIRWFSDHDKHELVAPALIGAKSVGVKYDPNLAGFEWILTPGAGLQLHDKTLLYKVKFVDDARMNVPPFVTPDISFGHGRYPWIAVDTVWACGQHTTAIIERFRAVTPEFAP